MYNSAWIKMRNIRLHRRFLENRVCLRIPVKSATQSGGRWPPGSEEDGHPFRTKAASPSGDCHCVTRRHGWLLGAKRRWGVVV